MMVNVMKVKTMTFKRYCSSIVPISIFQLLGTPSLCNDIIVIINCCEASVGNTKSIIAKMTIPAARDNNLSVALFITTVYSPEDINIYIALINRAVFSPHFKK